MKIITYARTTIDNSTKMMTLTTWFSVLLLGIASQAISVCARVAMQTDTLNSFVKDLYLTCIWYTVSPWAVFTDMGWVLAYMGIIMTVIANYFAAPSPRVCIDHAMVPGHTYVPTAYDPNKCHGITDKNRQCMKTAVRDVNGVPMCRCRFQHVRVINPNMR